MPMPLSVLVKLPPINSFRAAYRSVKMSGDKVLLFNRINQLCPLLCVSVFLSGCGGGSDSSVAAGGVVTYQGTPIAKIVVVFNPADGKGQIAEGTTDAKGNFKLQTRIPGDGALVGNYTVAFKYVPDEVPEMPGFPGAKKVVSPIPEKYGDASKSGITAVVDANSSKNAYKFDLTK